MVTVVWVVGIFVIWEIFAFVVQATKRTPINVLPHIWQIVGSFFSDSKVSGQLTMAELIGQSCAETLLRAGIGFLIGTVVGYVLALLMNLSGVVEKIAFPYLMLIQMIPILGMAPIILAITGDINTSRIVIAAILTFYPVSTNVLAGFKAVEREKHELSSGFFARIKERKAARSDEIQTSFTQHLGRCASRAVWRVACRSLADAGSSRVDWHGYRNNFVRDFDDCGKADFAKQKIKVISESL